MSWLVGSFGARLAAGLCGAVGEHSSAICAGAVAHSRQFESGRTVGAPDMRRDMWAAVLRSTPAVG